ncbi:MAG TPA: hypothetical protein VHW65_09045 [Gemmatimonadales bacterium]|jgi:type II secretory pathway component PulK|nr:hypothetical protein [Gemmatimonadales bacterium]
MIAALWLVVAISVVALQFALDAKERRTLALNASEQGINRGLALGALSLMDAKLDYALRSGVQNNTAVAGTRSGDPWMDADSVFSGTVLIDSMPVVVKATDLGTMININTASDTVLRTFFGLVLKDYAKADQLADMIADWRDIDDNPRLNGDEADGYEKKGLLTLPANQPFRAVSDLLQVEGFTPAIYDEVAPYFTVYGTGTVNLNTAPEDVLRSLPGMTDAIYANILAARSRGLRISSVAQVVPGVATGGGRGGRGGAATGAQTMASIQLVELQRAAVVDTREVLLTMTAKSASQARPVQLIALLTRAGTAATVSWLQW